MAEENTESNIEKGNLYEIGFHALPTLTEEEAVVEIGGVVGLIEKHQGVVKNTFNPQIRDLAYEMTKTISGKKQNFGRAYFGHVVFEASPEIVGDIRKEVEVQPNILRALTIEIEPESLLPRERRIPQTHREELKHKSATDLETPIAPMSEAELDKTIEALVIE
ncbi:MAG: 30S ribosomal protein S6 [bacterium]|nr:30S ribosomal protein S6 [bacterium]